MDPGRIIVRVVFAFLWALILVRLSGKRTIQQADVSSFVVAVVIGDLFDDLFWAEVSLAQFAIGLGALMIAHLLVTITNFSAGDRIWRRAFRETRQ
jgi:uncharacterized membrane protein YcaP (DUF421 family)